jgi:hypothetical protein
LGRERRLASAHWNPAAVPPMAANLNVARPFRPAILAMRIFAFGRF